METHVNHFLSQIQSCRDMFWLRQLSKKCEQFLLSHEPQIAHATLTPQQEQRILFIADIRDASLLRINQLEREMHKTASASNSRFGFGINLHIDHHFSDDNINLFVDYLCYRLYCADCLIG